MAAEYVMTVVIVIMNRQITKTS